MTLEELYKEYSFIDCPSIDSIEDINFQNRKVWKTAVYHITNLPSLANCVNLKKLDVSYSLLKKMPFLPESLRELSLNHTKMELPKEYPQLDWIEMNFAGVKKINNLPSSLKSLWASYNIIKSITIPHSLKLLSMRDSQLKGLLNLKRYDELEIIDVRDNPIDKLVLPKNIKTLVLSNTNLKRISLPDSIEFYENLGKKEIVDLDFKPNDKCKFMFSHKIILKSNELKKIAFCKEKNINYIIKEDSFLESL